ncbi:MAG TPA: cytochrome c-type biogenesis protein CcmH [Gemmatimonadales bacterium]|jgi:cytochrome c-type biogenesis protein CcmH/NrfF|nr:cytochrome c-type biogenesis protein CcmH [Gemmatimonadales bacterium]
MLSRRAMLRGMAGHAMPGMRQVPSQAPAHAIDTTHAGADPLDNPDLAGRTAAPLSPYDNDPGIIAIERRLRCTCGCTLDVFTCRTTDFTCTYSPAMHQDVIAMVKQGQQPEQIVQAFVSRYGESVLMAPPARGFNLAGYLVPGLAITAGGLLLVAWVGRRKTQVATAAAASASIPPGEAQLAELQRALDEVDS